LREVVLSPNIIVEDYRTDGTRNWDHQGIDIAAPAGTPIRASAGGVVAEIGVDGDPNNLRPWYGNYVILDHGEGIETRYAHMESPSGLAVGAAVTQGDVLGGTGNTGFSFGNHLHFETREYGEAFDSREILPGGVFP